MFQFLSRNSSRSRIRFALAIGPDAVVSIPQSEFFSFTPKEPQCHTKKPRSFNSSVGILLVHAAHAVRNNPSKSTRFNSSVGILLVHARLAHRDPAQWQRFQFLSRNSSRSRPKPNGANAASRSVSIPQSEFFSFTLLYGRRHKVR